LHVSKVERRRICRMRKHDHVTCNTLGVELVRCERLVHRFRTSISQIRRAGCSIEYTKEPAAATQKSAIFWLGSCGLRLAIFSVQSAVRRGSGGRTPINLKYNQGLDLGAAVPTGHCDAILISNSFCKTIAALSFRIVLAGIKVPRPAPSDSVCPIEKVCYITQEPAGHPRSRWSKQKTGRGGDRGS
jgi:hypothetical protein